MVEVGEPIVGGVAAAADSYVQVKPPTGEIWLIFTVGSQGDGSNHGFVCLSDGSSYDMRIAHAGRNIGEGDAEFSLQCHAKVFVTSDIFLKFKNERPDTALLIYMGVRVK